MIRLTVTERLDKYHQIWCVFGEMIWGEIINTRTKVSWKSTQKFISPPVLGSTETGTEQASNGNEVASQVRLQK